MKGLILTNSYSHLKSQEMQVERFVHEFRDLNVDVDVLAMSVVPCLIDNGNINSLKDKYDFVLYLDKDKYYARILENLGLRIFNKPSAIEICDDKMLTHIELAKHNVSMPKTIPGVLCYSDVDCIDSNLINRIEEELKYPLVVKECFGSLGKGVYLVNNRDELISYSKQLINKPHLFQEFINESFGKDIRVLVIGGKAFAWMMRKSENDFRSNIEIGGEPINIELPDEFRKCAENVATFLNLDYCGVDLLIGPNNTPLVCEVNSNAFFNALELVTGKNVAKAYCEYIIKSI